ncbi:MAG: hypothetical protein HOM84_07185 [Thiotrichales bacterium]|jgi:hypothetical protein|nr:hypothetical protein [Thiotrichales bacterium]MBT3613096.1 hypothetical protein [Thiotrichales bacterium]MBT3752139.1 hypothetical protein [Thiotrichales bacterium]MBT3837811.1 hypothetical protein [Thiotrichales bacterium]MBT4152774.1 hypothetical protein [Thiotrichales bacterium]
MSEMTTVEIVVLGVVLLFATHYLWRYIKRILGIGSSNAECGGCNSCGESKKICK